jgi:hypothetical protein
MGMVLLASMHALTTCNGLELQVEFIGYNYVLYVLQKQEFP